MVTTITMHTLFLHRILVPEINEPNSISMKLSYPTMRSLKQLLLNEWCTPRHSGRRCNYRRRYVRTAWPRSEGLEYLGYLEAIMPIYFTQLLLMPLGPVVARVMVLLDFIYCCFPTYLRFHVSVVKWALFYAAIAVSSIASTSDVSSRHDQAWTTIHAGQLWYRV